jgi:hypothetical protein
MSLVMLAPENADGERGRRRDSLFIKRTVVIAERHCVRGLK